MTDPNDKIHHWTDLGMTRFAQKAHEVMLQPGGMPLFCFHPLLGEEAKSQDRKPRYIRYDRSYVIQKLARTLNSFGSLTEAEFSQLFSEVYEKIQESSDGE